MRDLQARVPEVVAARDQILALRPDLLLLQRFDHDFGGQALTGFQALLAEAGHPMPFAHAPPSNSGLPTTLDLDGDGRRGRFDDAQGFGRFQGAGSMVLLSRFPLRADPERDFTRFLWSELPQNGFVGPEAARPVQRLASTGAWEVAVVLPGAPPLRLLAWHASPPVFGATAGRNPARNRDENRFWSLLLDGALPMPAPQRPFLLMGSANLDPDVGDGAREAIRDLLRHRDVQDPQPADLDGRRGTSPGGRPARRSAYLLPSQGLEVRGAGLHRPPEFRWHALLWLDLGWPP